jgi:hypothetical protein
MKQAAIFIQIFCLALTAFAGFKVKLVKPKKPEQFQVRATVAEVIYAADLLLEGNDQDNYFYKELSPSDVIAVRLAVFNKGKDQVELPADLQLLDPQGQEVPLLAPDTVAQAVLRGMVVTAEARKKESPVSVRPSTPVGDPRTDPSDPRYDPRIDPSRDPRRDPRNDPSYPGYDPSDPRNRRGGYPGGWGRPGVDVVLNPRGGGGGGDLSQFEKQLVEKDFDDKSHTNEPILSSLTRDRFLFFSLKDRPKTPRGFTLRLPKTKGIPEDVVLKF